MLGPSRGLISFKVAATDLQQLVRGVETKWKALAPGMPFSYRFLDESFDEMYRSEQRVGKVAMTFALLTILIACLGLFGLVTYAAEQRIKEIGIRKVLGASVGDIVAMLSKDYLKPVLLAALLAFPLSWYVMHRWLEDFSYRVTIRWWIFLVAGSLSLLIALLTVSLQAIRAGLASPIKNLRTE
jgi:putative ABC transport system permease protein